MDKLDFGGIVDDRYCSYDWSDGSNRCSGGIGGYWNRSGFGSLWCLFVDSELVIENLVGVRGVWFVGFEDERVGKGMSVIKFFGCISFFKLFVDVNY